MKLRKTVFGSKTEAKLYKSLVSRWSSKLSIYPNLPFSKIVQLDKNEFTLEERDYFYKTNIDFTICKLDDQPLFSIEFDGIGHGFSRDGKYVQTCNMTDPLRKRKMDFKLKVANKINFPFMIVSFEEIEFFDKEDSLTILDGIIGQILARKEFERRIGNVPAEIESYHPDIRDEYIQDFISSSEVEAELMYDPIALKAAEMGQICFEFGISSYTFIPLTDPPLPDIKDLFDIKAIEARINAMKKTIREGCRVEINTSKGIIAQESWVRNFEGFGISPISIVRNIAEYLAFKKVLSMLPKM